MWLGQEKKRLEKREWDEGWSCGHGAKIGHKEEELCEGKDKRGKIIRFFIGW